MVILVGIVLSAVYISDISKAPLECVDCLSSEILKS